MRAAISGDAPLGQRVNSFIQTGKLVPDEIVMDIVADRIQQPDCQSGFIFDGFPRTVKQAEMLDGLLKKDEKSLTSVVQLIADDEEVTRRLLARAEIEGRSDDSPETIAHRLEVYHSQTSPLTKFYRQRNLLIEVDGTGKPSDVFDSIVTEIEQMACNNSRE